LGFNQFLLAKLLVKIPSYVYFLVGYSQGVGERALQKYSSSGHSEVGSQNTSSLRSESLSLNIE
jgi:hypothetical protein